MRQSLLIGGVFTVGAVLAMACSSSGGNGSDPGPDAGASSGTSGTSGTSGAPDGGSPDGDAGDDRPVPTPTALKAGETVLLGVTSDGYAAYLAIDGEAMSLEVVAVTGGTPTVLLPSVADTDMALVSGGAIAYWTAVDDAGIGTINYWTKATGTKAAVAAGSSANVFVANAEGTRVAFSVGATATSTALAVTDAATGSVTPVLTGGNAMNLAAAAPAGDATAAACTPAVGFVGKVLLGAYCTGTDATTTAAVLVKVPDGASPTAKRLDAPNDEPGSIQPFWSANGDADKVFVIGSGDAQGRILFDGDTVTAASLETDTQDGRMLTDGSAVVFRVENAGGTTKAIRHATAVATPVTTDLVETGAAGFVAFSDDEKQLLYRTLVPTNEGFSDIRSLHVAPPHAPFTHVPGATGYPFGFAGDSTTVLYQSNVDANGLGSLMARPVGGGAERELAKGMFDARTMAGGTGVVISDNPQTNEDTSLTTFDITWVDAVAGGTPKLLAKAVGDYFEVSGKRLVFTNDSGLFSTALP